MEIYKNSNYIYYSYFPIITINGNIGNILIYIILILMIFIYIYISTEVLKYIFSVNTEIRFIHILPLVLK